MKDRCDARTIPFAPSAARAAITGRLASLRQVIYRELRLAIREITYEDAVTKSGLADTQQPQGSDCLLAVAVLTPIRSVNLPA